MCRAIAIAISKASRINQRHQWPPGSGGSAKLAAQHTAELHQVKLRPSEAGAPQAVGTIGCKNEKCPALPGIIDEFLF
jgi:hypothetical protein